MSIPVSTIAAIVGAGHPEHALVGVPISLLRELLQVLPVAVIGVASPAPGDAARADGDAA